MTNYENLFVLSGLFDDENYQIEIAADFDLQIKVARGEVDHFDNVPTATWKEIGRGSEPDIVRTTVLPGIALSAAAVSKMSVLTGWHPVEIHGPEQTSSTRNSYSLMSITGRAGPVDPTRSIISSAEDALNAEIKGLFFRDDYWDGSDVFVLKESAFFVFVTAHGRSTISEICDTEFRPTFTQLTEFVQHPLGMQNIVNSQVADGLTKAGSNLFYRPPR